MSSLRLPRGAMPGTVLALVILLYFSGGSIILYGLAKGGSSVPFYVVYGIVYIGLAAIVQLGRSWARAILLLLCAVGVIRGLLVLTEDVYSAAWLLAGPALYLVLLNTGTARLWFHQPRQAMEEQ